MKTLKIIGLIMLFGGVLMQIIDYFLLETSAENFFIGPFFWGAVITCLGAILLTIYRLSTGHEKSISQKRRMKNIIVVDTNILPDRYDVYFGNRLNVVEEAQNLSYTETVSDEDRRSQQIHCQLTTPGLWPCE